MDVCQQRIDEPGARVAPRRAGISSNANPRVNERSHQPRPDGSLMIDSVAGCRITFIPRRVTWLARRKRPQPDRRQEMPLDRIDNSPPAFPVHERNRESTDGENLILLVNLAWSARLYASFLRHRGSFAALERWQIAYLPVYAVWAALVVVMFPPLFGYR